MTTWVYMVSTRWCCATLWEGRP